jgi:two-component system, NarL family, response regulator NreC
MSISILIADDHKIMRDGLRSLAENETDMEVIAEADNGRSAVKLAIELSPAVVLMDISMPDMNGIEATRQILAALPKCKVVALSMNTDKRIVMEMLKAGASAYLLKNCAYEELTVAIRTVMRNKTYLSADVTGIVVGDLIQQQQRGNGSAFSVLSAREREVLQLLAEGFTTTKIADRLHLSGKTIDTYRQHIMKKLDIHSVAELTKYAIREGLTSL